MQFIYEDMKGLRMAALALMLALLFAGIAVPAQAQNHPPAFFPYPLTFEINGIVGYGNLLGVQAAVVGDFNGDGKLDVVSIPGGAWEIDVALGNGDGTFRAPTANTYTFPSGTSPYALAVGDFNGDGKLDLAVWCVYAPNDYNEVLVSWARATEPSPIATLILLQMPISLLNQAAMLSTWPTSTETVSSTWQRSLPTAPPTSRA